MSSRKPPHHQRLDKLFDAIKSGDVAAVRALTRKEPALSHDVHPVSNLNALHLAVIEKQIAIARHLVEDREADPCLPLDLDGKSAFERTAEGDEDLISMIEALLAKRSPEPVIPTNKAISKCIGIAAKNDHVGIVALILKLGDECLKGQQAMMDEWTPHVLRLNAAEGISAYTREQAQKARLGTCQKLGWFAAFNNGKKYGHEEVEQVVRIYMAKWLGYDEKEADGSGEQVQKDDIGGTEEMRPTARVGGDMAAENADDDGGGGGGASKSQKNKKRRDRKKKAKQIAKKGQGQEEEGGEEEREENQQAKEELEQPEAIVQKLSINDAPVGQEENAAIADGTTEGQGPAAKEAVEALSLQQEKEEAEEQQEDLPATALLQTSTAKEDRRKVVAIDAAGKDEEDAESYLLRDAPDDYLCPVSMVLMTEPVVAPDGRTYQRCALDECIAFAQQRGQPFKSPYSGLPMEPVYFPSVQIRNQIQDYVAEKLNAKQRKKVERVKEQSK